MLGAALAVLCIVLVALPFLREPAPSSDELDTLTPQRRRLLALVEERDRALAALKELEADHRARRINDEDYRRIGRAAPTRCRRTRSERSTPNAPSRERPPVSERAGVGLRTPIAAAATVLLLLLAAPAGGDPGTDKARLDTASATRRLRRHEHPARRRC